MVNRLIERKESSRLEIANPAAVRAGQGFAPKEPASLRTFSRISPFECRVVRKLGQGSHGLNPAYGTVVTSRSRKKVFAEVTSKSCTTVSDWAMNAEPT